MILNMSNKKTRQALEKQIAELTEENQIQDEELSDAEDEIKRQVEQARKEEREKCEKNLIELKDNWYNLGKSETATEIFKEIEKKLDEPQLSWNDKNVVEINMFIKELKNVVEINMFIKELKARFLK